MKKIMQEQLFHWYLNGSPQHSILCSPGSEEDLLIGNLFTSGLISGISQIRKVYNSHDQWFIEADVSSESADLADRLGRIEPCRSSRTAELSSVIDASDALMALDNSQGLHTVLLETGGNRIIYRDTGRHNAFDKAVGHALRNRCSLSDAVICISGRISIEILAKAGAAGIPILCTYKQVGDVALTYAEQWNICIVQNSKIQPEVLSAPWRISGNRLHDQ